MNGLALPRSNAGQGKINPADCALTITDSRPSPLRNNLAGLGSYRPRAVVAVRSASKPQTVERSGKPRLVSKIANLARVHVR